LLLDISEADAEGGTLTGGFEKKAEGLYKKSLQQAEAGMDSVSACVLPLLRSHCLNGLARLCLHGKYAEETSGPITAKEQAEKALADVILVRNNDSVPFYLWKAQDSSGSSALFHVNVSRQLIADSLVRASRPGDAQVFLEDAVRDSPADFDAMFALGSFRLRMALYESVDASPEEQKLAQTQLLKSAKIDSGKPGPFALLGIWYEVQNDLKRAVGCYSKCLLLDPSNPVAGRGLLRLKSPTEAQKLCEAATKSNSPVNGWAWQAMGVEKSMKENDNDLAIVCFLQALRCRDIECPQNEPFSIFFTLPNLAGLTSELSHVWAELAGCYRRVGRYAAAARAFQSAWQVEEEKLASQVLCSWAQGKSFVRFLLRGDEYLILCNSHLFHLPVELELGLFEEATEKFDLVLQREKDPSRTIAAYGQGSALLSLGRRDALDGKAAAAIQHVSRAISSIENIFLREGVASPPAGCALELLGLLYSFGALLPPDVFLEVADDGSHVDEQSMLKAQASFVANGEKAYRDAADSLIASDEDEIHALRAAMLCDLGSNILLQGQIMSSAYGVAQGCTPDLTLRDVIEMNSEVKSMYDRSIDVFKDAISVSPLHGPAWCGLGCSLSVTDPLLAQHALCTALTVDKMMPDSWSNLAFLFAEKDANAQSAEMLDGLTQVADSPLMWICRALLLEREVQLDSGPCEPLISRAADAYRAALQVVKHPSALLGLSLTCRATVSTTPVSNEEKTSMYGSISSDLARRDSYGYMSEYVGLSSGTNLGSCVLGSVMTLEDAVVAVKTKPLGLDQVLKSEAIEEAYVNISKGIEGLERLSSPSSVLDSVPGVDVDPIKDVVGRVSSLASNTEDTADVSTETDPFDHRLTPSRRIIHDPETGIAWLDLAKSLAKELLSVSDSKKKKVVKEVLESATRASDCAARILSNQVSDPVKVRSPPHVVSNDSEEEVVMSVAVVPAIVDARDVSEALALSYWIETIEMYIVDVEGDERSPKRALDLQRALLMDPSNAFAREALQRTIPTT
jgi:tetratricopeptide (TPR) repeat protein